MADENPKPIPDRWKLLVKKKDGSSDSVNSLLQKFSPKKRTRMPEKKVSTADVADTEKSSDSEDSMFNLPSIASLDLLDAESPPRSEKPSATRKTKLENRSSSEACSCNKGKSKKQKN